MEWLRSLIGRSPRLALVVGKTVFLAGGILVVGAVFARAGLVAINAERSNAQLPALRTLSQAYPQYPTWLVPEGPLGFGIAAALTLVGMALTVLAADAQKAGRRGPQ